MKLKIAIALIIMLVLLALGFWLGWRGADGRFAELRETVVSEADVIKAQSAARFDSVESRLERMEKKIDQIDARSARIESKLDRLIDLATPRLPDNMKAVQ